MGRRFSMFWAALGPLLTLAAHASAAPFDVAQPLLGQPMGRYIRVLPDESGSMALADALAADARGEFRRSPDNYPNFSPSHKPIWVRIDVVNSGSQNVKWLLEMSHPFADIVELYSSDGKGGYKAWLTGASRPLSTRPELHRTFVFPLITARGASDRYYFRIQGNSAIIAAFNAWTQSSFDAWGRLEEFGFGLFYGVVLGLFAYNLLLWLTLRDPPTLWYLAYLIMMSLAYAGFFGHGALFLWRDYPGFAGGRDMQFFYFAAYYFYFQFARCFLDTRQHSRRLDRILRWCSLFGAVMTPASLLIPTQINHYVLSLSQLALLILPVIAAYVWRMGFRPARYSFFATSIFATALVVLGFWNFGFIDVGPRFFYLVMSVGSSAELVLFSMALADRVNMLRIQKQLAQRQAEEALRQAAADLERRIALRTSELTRAMQQAEMLARTDPLTGVMNRRAFFEAGEVEVKRVRRYGTKLSLAVLDLDHFKGINDTYGHAGGDMALVAVAGIAREVLRDLDLFGRIGGEEFGILLPDTGVEEADLAAERLRLRIAECTLVSNGKEFHITASFGVARATGDIAELSDLVKAADAAMYIAKESGRNCVVVAGTGVCEVTSCARSD